MSSVTEGPEFGYGSSLTKVENARLVKVRNEKIDMVTKGTIPKHRNWLA